MKITREIGALIAVMSSSFLTPFATTALNLSLPDIGREFSAEPSLLSWLLEIFLLSSIVFLLPFGRAADRFGKSAVFLPGMFLFAAASFLTAYAEDFRILLLLRALQGIGGSMIFATGMAILTVVFPKERRGWAFGWNVSMVYVGLALGPVFGGFLNYAFGWRSIFLFLGGYGLLAFVLAFMTLPRDPAESKGTTDLVGMVLYGISTVSTMYGLSEIARDPAAPGILIGGGALFLVFLRYELRISSPIFPVRLFVSNRVFSYAGFTAMINHSATYGLSFLLSVYLQSVLDFDSRAAGGVLLIQPLFMALLSPWAGRLSDRRSPALIASIGMALIAVSLSAAGWTVYRRDFWELMVCIAILGIGFALFAAPNNNALMSAVKKSDYGVAASALGTVRLIGQVLSIAIVSSILSLHWDYGVKESLACNITSAFAVFSVLCIIGTYTSMRGRKAETKREKETLAS